MPVVVVVGAVVVVTSRVVVVDEVVVDAACSPDAVLLHAVAARLTASSVAAALRRDVRAGQAMKNLAGEVAAVRLTSMKDRYRTNRAAT